MIINTPNDPELGCFWGHFLGGKVDCCQRPKIRLFWGSKIG